MISVDRLFKWRTPSLLLAGSARHLRKRIVWIHSLASCIILHYFLGVSRDADEYFLGVTVFFVAGFAIALVQGRVKASQHLHQNLLFRILRCPMSFFDTTPLGRILNRFSKDVDTVDVLIPATLSSGCTVTSPSSPPSLL